MGRKLFIGMMLALSVVGCKSTNYHETTILEMAASHQTTASKKAPGGPERKTKTAKLSNTCVTDNPPKSETKVKDEVGSLQGTLVVSQISDAPSFALKKAIPPQKPKKDSILDGEPCDKNIEKKKKKKKKSETDGDLIVKSDIDEKQDDTSVKEKDDESSPESTEQKTVLLVNDSGDFELKANNQELNELLGSLQPILLGLGGFVLIVLFLICGFVHQVGAVVYRGFQSWGQRIDSIFPKPNPVPASSEEETEEDEESNDDAADDDNTDDQLVQSKFEIEEAETAVPSEVHPFLIGQFEAIFGQLHSQKDTICMLVQSIRDLELQQKTQGVATNHTLNEVARKLSQQIENAKRPISIATTWDDLRSPPEQTHARVLVEIGDMVHKGASKEQIQAYIGRVIQTTHRTC